MHLAKWQWLRKNNNHSNRKTSNRSSKAKKISHRSSDNNDKNLSKIHGGQRKKNNPSSDDVKAKAKVTSHHSTEEHGKERYFPVEIITEILSRLPAKSLVRFQCVSKLWNALIKDKKFEISHMERSEWVPVYGKQEGEFLQHLHGLVLENIVSTKKYRIRNPTINYNLDLPNPSGDIISMKMFFLEKTNDYKLVCVDSRDGGGCQVFRIGADSTWRDIGSFSASGQPGFVLFDATTLTSYVASDSKIAILEVESEKFEYVDIPHGIVDNTKEVHLFYGKTEKICFTHLVGLQMHIWTLEDYKKNTWSESKIEILLKLFGNCEPRNLKTLQPLHLRDDGWLVFKRKDGRHGCYNLHSKGYHFRTRQVNYHYLPTLLDCEKPVNFEEKLGELVHQRDK